MLLATYIKYSQAQEQVQSLQADITQVDRDMEEVGFWIVPMLY